MYETIRATLAGATAGTAVALGGWVRSARHSKNVSFVDLVDGSCMSGIQVVADRELAGYAEHVAHLRTGCAIVVEGELVESPGSGQKLEVHARRVELVGDVTDDYPLQKKRQSFEFLRQVQHLRPRTNTLGAIYRVRSAATRAVHDFFDARGFVYLHSPIITATDCEGAGDMFRVTTFDLDAPPRGPDGGVDFAQDFFGEAAHLTVSGQLEAEIAALALSRVYTFGPTFRAENSNTTRHLAEFWMIEPEVAFCELPELMVLVEQFIKGVVARVMETAREDLEFFDLRIEKGLLERLERLVSSDFERLTYTECIAILEKSSKSFEYTPTWGGDLQTEHERYLCETHVGRPVIVTDYPAEKKAFYMYRNDDGKTVRAMDVLVPAIGEIVGGSQREHREAELLRQMELHGLDASRYDWYVDLRRHGSVPHSGFGVGFERLVRMLTGMENIRDVVPFPRVPGSASI